MNRLTKLSLCLAMLCIAGISVGWYQQAKIVSERGGARLVIKSGGALDIESGGEMDVESGGSLKIGGTAITATAAEFNVLAGAVQGAKAASKAVVVDALGAIDTLTIDDLLTLTPTDVEPAASEGNMYWDDSEDSLKVHNGTNYIALSTGSGDNTLNDAYDQGGAGAGRTITADTGAVVITNTDNDAAFLLDITPTPGGAAASGGIVITSGAFATEDALQFNNSGSGSDIQGTGSTWTITKAGVLTAADAQLTTATISSVLSSNQISLANGGLITNDTNNEIEFEENSEEFSLAFTSNTVTFATDTGVDTVSMGDVDDLAGVGTITFDAAASTITLPADGANDDLTIRVTNAQDASLILSSAGTAADALQVISTAGGIDITNGGAAGGEDIDIVSSNASVNVTSGEDVTGAIYLHANSGTSETIRLHADLGEGADSIDLESDAGGITLDTGADDDIALTAGADVNLPASVGLTFGDDGEKIEGNGTDMTIESSGNLNLLSSVNEANAIDIQANSGTSETVRIYANQGDGVASVHLLSDDGGITIDTGADDDIALTAGADVNIPASVGLTFGDDGEKIEGNGADMTIGASNDLSVTATGNLNLTTNLNEASALYLHSDSGTTETIKIHCDQGDTATSIEIVSDDGGITLDAGANDSITTASPLDVNEAIVGDGGAAISGMLYTVTNDIDGKVLTIAEAGTVQTNSGAGGGGVWDLPEASTAIGMYYTFVTVAVQNLDINPDNGDQILVLTNAAGDAVRNATAGNTLTLLAIDATNWVVIGEKGTWTDVD